VPPLRRTTVRSYVDRNYRCEENEHFTKLPNVKMLAENKLECHIPHTVPIVPLC